MASQKLSDLTPDATPGYDSLMYTVDDPAGTAVSRQSTIQEIFESYSTGDIGKTGSLVGDIFIGDNKSLYVGDDQDLQVYHTGAYGGLKNNTGGLYIDGASGEDIIFRISSTLALTLDDDKAAFVGEITCKTDLDILGATTETCALDVGFGRSGSGISKIELIGDTTYTSGGAGLFRYGGENATTILSHRGTDELRMEAVDAGSFTVFTDSTLAMTIDSSQLVSFANQTFGELATAAEWTTQQNFNELAITSSSNATAWNTDTAQCALHTMTENTTISAPSNLNAGGTYLLRVVQAAGLYTLAFNAVFKWGEASTPTAPSASGDVLILSFYSDGTNMYGVEAIREEA